MLIYYVLLALTGGFLQGKAGELPGGGHDGVCPLPPP